MPVQTVALDRSNKWDHLRQVRLSATRQTCTVLSARQTVPWVFQLGSRGNPPHVSNTAGDARRHCTPNFEQVASGMSQQRISSQGELTTRGSQLELLTVLQRGFDPLAQN